MTSICPLKLSFGSIASQFLLELSILVLNFFKVMTPRISSSIESRSLHIEVVEIGKNVSKDAFVS